VADVAPKQSLGAGYRNGEKYPEADDMPSAFRAAANLAITFVAPSPGPVILINHVPVTDSASMRRKRYAVLQRPTPERVSGLSDAVFAVLITVLVFNLRPPELPTFGALLLLWPTWLSYAVSYLFIAIVWTNHHYLMRYATEANLRLLFVVVQLRASIFHVASSAFYRLDGEQRVGAATCCLLCSGFLLRERHLHILDLGAR
jgi:hypothetical protein